MECLNVWKRRKVKSNTAFMCEKKFVKLNQPIWGGSNITREGNEY